MLQYQTVQKTSIDEQVVVQMPFMRSGELHEYPCIQTTNMMTTTSIMDKGFNSFMENGNSMHLSMPMNSMNSMNPMSPAATTSQVMFTHETTEALMEVDLPPNNTVSYFICSNQSLSLANSHTKSQKKGLPTN